MSSQRLSAARRRLAPTVLFSVLASSATQAQGPAALATTIATAARPVRFDSVQVATGVRLHYAEQGTAPGTPVILLHGYTDSWFSYSRVLSDLSVRRRVYALDQRGHGRSEQPAGGYAMTSLADDVVAFMDAKKLPRAVIVGHSMGGVVAQHVAARAPARVSRLVLVSTVPSIGELSGLGEFGGAVLALEDPVPPEFARDFQMSTVAHPVPSEFMERAISESLRLPARVWKGLWKGMISTPPVQGLAESGIPTLIIWGEKDTIMPKDGAVNGLTRVVPHAKVLVYAGTGHAPHWERPETFVVDLESFLQD